MEENDGIIKIKTDMSHTIMTLIVVGLFAYFEIYGIKRLIDAIKTSSVEDMVATMVILFLIHLVYAFCGFDLINMGRKIELTKVGCTISFLWIKRRYSWGEYLVKKVEKYSDYSMRAPDTPYDEGAVFSKVPIKRPKRYRPGEVSSFITPCVFSTVWVCFRNERCKRTMRLTGYFEVDKEEFLQKMEEWGVELEMPE